MVPLTTSYLTDLEGNGTYFEEFLKISHAIFRDKKHRLQIRDNYRFVFGGDLFDRGHHDLRLAADLTDLKVRYPDRVTLILGNRDTQKLKLKSLMDPSWWKGREPADLVMPYYFQIRAFDKSFGGFLRRNPPKGSHPAAEDYLQYLLENHFSVAMGITNTRRELMEIRLLNEHYEKTGDLLSWGEVSKLLENISFSDRACSTGFSHVEATRKYLKRCYTDEEMVRLYDRVVCSDNNVNNNKCDNGPLVTESSLDGIIIKYLKLTQIAAIHEGALFVHGAVTGPSVGYVPHGSLEERPYPDNGPDVPGRNMAKEGASPEQWVAELNKFHIEQIHQWEDSPHFDEVALERYLKDTSRKEGWFPKRGGGALFAYGYSKSTQYRSVIVGNYFQEKVRPRLGTRNTSAYEDLNYMDMEAVRYLTKSGINAVFNGHQPVGDLPHVIRQSGIRVVMADNSYCMNSSATEDGRNIPHFMVGRGDAVQEVLYNSETGTIRMHGRLVNGEPFDFIDENNDYSTVGRRLWDGWWVRAPVYMNKDGSTSLVTTPLAETTDSLKDNKESNKDGVGYLLRRSPDRFFTFEEVILRDHPCEDMKMFDGTDGEKRGRLRIDSESFFSADESKNINRTQNISIIANETTQ